MIAAVFVVLLPLTLLIAIAGAADALNHSTPCRYPSEALIVGFGQSAQVMISVIPFGIVSAAFGIWMGWF